MARTVGSTFHLVKTTIRPLTRDDESFLWHALYHALHVPSGADRFPPEIVRQPALARYVARWMQRPGDLGFVAEARDVPIGAAWLRCWTASDRGFGFVDEATPELSMSIVPAHRGRGIGTELLRRLLSDAERAFEAVSLSVSESNPARRMYERAGFVHVGEPDGGSVTMVKRFGPRR